MPLTFAENAALLVADPTGSKRRQIAEEIQRIPARVRYIVGLRSGIIAKLDKGASQAEAREMWKKVDAYAAELFRLDNWVRKAWEIARQRGDVTGPVPTQTTTGPDRPGKLAGFIEYAAIGAQVAVLIAALVVVGAALFATGIPAALALVIATVGVLVALVPAVSLWLSTALPPSPGSVLKASAGISGVLVAGALLVFLLANKGGR